MSNKPTYNNDALAAVVMTKDPSAGSWVYNRHCQFCGKFLYPEESSSKCSKCNTQVTTPLLRVLPFISSATAIEKLLVWTRRYPELQQLRKDIIQIMSRWLESDLEPDRYRMEIVVRYINALSSSEAR